MRHSQFTLQILSATPMESSEVKAAVGEGEKNYKRDENNKGL